MKKKLPIIILLICGVLLIGYGTSRYFSTEDIETPSTPEQNGNANEEPTDDEEEPVEDIPIEIVNNTNYKVVANSINNQKGIAVLIQSNEEMNQVLKITTTLTDADNNIIASDESYSSILGNDYTIYTTPLVNKEGADLNQSKINIVIDKEGEYMNMLQASMFELNDQSNVEGNSIHTSLTMTYKGTESLEKVSGYVVALKKNRIIGVSSFSKEQVEPGSVSDLEVEPMNIVLNTEEETIDYDDILVFVNNFGF